MKDLTVVGQRIIYTEKELLETLYLQKNDYMSKIKYLLKRKNLFSEVHDIFTDSLLILREKYYKKGKFDYTELRKILFGICRIQTYRFISIANHESNVGFLKQSINRWDSVDFDMDNIDAKSIVTEQKYTAYQNWYREYQREYFKDPKNREKHNAHYRTEEYKKIRRARENILREQGDLRAQTNARVKAYNERVKEDPERYAQILQYRKDYYLKNKLALKTSV